MKYIVLIGLLLIGVLNASDNRSKEEIENENLKLRLLLLKASQQNKTEKFQEELKKEEKKESAHENKTYYYGIGLVSGQSIGKGDNGINATHNRLDLYIYNANFPSWTAKVGYAQQEQAQLEYFSGISQTYAFIPKSDILVLSLGYNLFNFHNVFMDFGLLYHQVLSETNYDGKVTSTYSDGSYYKADRLRILSSPGAELGLGYSFGDFSIRVDFTLITDGFESKETRYDNSDQPKYSGKEWAYGQLYTTVGLTYWF